MDGETQMTLGELLDLNGHYLTDADLAALADWAHAQKADTPNPSWHRAYALIREGCDLLLRRRATIASQCDYLTLRQQLGDYSSTFYGPHPCKDCGVMIVKRADDQGGAAWIVPPLNAMAGSPMQAYLPHRCLHPQVAAPSELVPEHTKMAGCKLDPTYAEQKHCL